MHVYVVQHSHMLSDREEDFKFIGVYSSRLNAEAAVHRLSTLHGFAESPLGFSIDLYELDQDHWTDGYVTVAAPA